MEPSTSVVTEKQKKSRPMKPWTFRVNCRTNPGEIVCVTGNVPELGHWSHTDAVDLQLESELNGGSSGGESSGLPPVWTQTVSIPRHKTVKYRYFVCMLEDNLRGDPTKVRIIRRWETHLEPRRIAVDDQQPEGALPDSEVFGAYDGIEKFDHGWLTSETVVQFHLANNALQLWKHRNSKIRFKMVTMDLTRKSVSADINEGESADSLISSSSADSQWPITEIAVLNEQEYEFRLQSQFGHVYDPAEVVILQAQVMQLTGMAFKIDFYKENPNDIPVFIGFCYILPAIFRQSNGAATLPVTSLRQDLIGQLSMEFVVIRPMPNCPCDMKVSYASQWKSHWKGLDVGHRGSGNSTKHSATLRENTIASLAQAADCGADFVEFDVQLSKDLIPVLFHDFFVHIGLEQRAKLGGAMTTLTVPVKDLTVAELHKLKVYHAKDTVEAEDESEGPDHDPFPTLQHALEVINPHVGFNVEIKWTMQLKDGTWELDNPIELNTFLDIVLQTVLEHAGSRKIVFSSFHPDICAMVRYKQNKYPVLFLTQGITQKYPEYNDPRTQNIPIAVLFAKSANLLGLCVHTEDILRDPKQVEYILSQKLVAFCWGDDNNDKGTIKYLKELGMNGIIYDRIADHVEEEKMNIFLVEDNNELMNIASKSSGVLSPGSHSFDRSTDEDSVSVDCVSSSNTNSSSNHEPMRTTFTNGMFF